MVVHLLQMLLAVLGVLLAAILFIPFGYGASMSRDKEGAEFDISVSWLWSFIRVSHYKRLFECPKTELNFWCFRIPVGQIREKDKKTGRKKKQKDDKKKSNFTSYLDRDFILRGAKALKDLLKSISPREFEADIRIGFEDPYHTGLLTAILYTLRELLPTYGVRIRTVFDEEVYEGWILIRGRLVLSRIAVIAIELYLSKSFRDIQKKIKKIQEAENYGA